MVDPKLRRPVIGGNNVNGPSLRGNDAEQIYAVE